MKFRMKISNSEQRQQNHNYLIMISLLKVVGNVLFCKGTLSWKGKIYLPRTSDNSTRITPLASILQVLWSIFCQYH